MLLEILRKKYKQAETEKIKEMEKERKELTDPVESDLDLEPPPRETKQQTVEEANKTIQLRE
jgi:hypothetical protein